MLTCPSTFYFCLTERRALKSVSVLAAIEKHGMQTATACDIAVVAEHYGLAIPRTSIIDKLMSGTMLLQVVRVSDLLLELDMSVEASYFAMAALVGVSKHTAKVGKFPPAPLASLSEWMRRQVAYSYMADSFRQHNVTEICVPLLEAAVVPTAVSCISSINARDLIAEFTAAHTVPGWAAVLCGCD